MNEPKEIPCLIDKIGDVVRFNNESYIANMVELVVMSGNDERCTEPAKTALWQSLAAKNYIYRSPYIANGNKIKCYGLSILETIP